MRAAGRWDLVLLRRSRWTASLEEAAGGDGEASLTTVYLAQVSPVRVNETECADLWLVGGYWNDDD